MIYITGDCHRDFRRFNTKNFPEQKEMTKEDYVIICGDFGGVWDREEMDEGLENLEKCGNKVDFIITHCCSGSTQAVFSSGMFTPDILTNYLEKIKLNTSFKKWFFGHYHDNRNISAEEIMLFEQIIRIN